MAKRQKEVKCEVIFGHLIYLWADDNVIEKVKGVEGVSVVDGKFQGHYTVYVDHRCSIKAIAKEIEALAGPPPQTMFGSLFKTVKAVVLGQKGHGQYGREDAGVRNTGDEAGTLD